MGDSLYSFYLRNGGLYVQTYTFSISSTISSLSVDNLCNHYLVGAEREYLLWSTRLPAFLYSRYYCSIYSGGARIHKV
jgi:hypothetical protein